MLRDGKCMTVGFYGDLDLDLHCEQDVRVTLTNVAVVPGLAFDIISFNRMQEKHEIVLNGAGASILGGRVRLKKFRAGNFIQATRVPHDDASPHPPAMVAAMMRPGAPSSMNVNNFLGHANIKTLYEAAKQMGIKLTGISFGYRRQAFQGEVPTWGGGAITSSRPWSSTASSPGAAPDPLAAATSSRAGGGGAITSSRPWSSTTSSPGAAPDPLAAATSSRDGGFPAATPAASAAPRGGGHSSHVFVWSGGYVGDCSDIFPRRGYSRRGSSGDYFGDIFPQRGSSRRGSSGDYFGDIFPRRGYSRRGSSDDYFGGCGDIFPRWGYSRRGSSGGGYRWHTRKRERSRTAGGSGCGAYATRIRPFRWSRNSYRRTFSDGAGAAGDEWWA